MTITAKTRKKPLRQLDAADLQVVTGGLSTVESPAAATGIIIYGATRTVEDGAIMFWRPV